FQMDVVAAGKRRRKPQTNAIFLEDDGDRLLARAPLDDGVWKLAARQKAGLAAVQSDQIRFRKALEQAFTLERLDRGTNLLLDVEHIQVEEIGTLPVAFFGIVHRHRVLLR